MENKCVSCGAELPAEGCDVCKTCEANAAELNCVEAAKKRVSFSYGDNPCLSIKNSYLVTKKADIKSVLEYIHEMDEYKKLQSVGYTRTIESEYREWKGHNTLHRLGVFRARTGSVDIDQKEPKLVRLIYAILSIF
jgi:hypothetical protein